MRRFASQRGILKAIGLLGLMIDSGCDLLHESSPREQSNDQKRNGMSRRELLPIPSPDMDFWEAFSGYWSRPCCAILKRLVHSTVCAVNCMFLGKRVALERRSLNSAQRAAILHFAGRWLSLARHLSGVSDLLQYDETALRRMIDKGAGGKGVRLQADLVDSLPSCAQVDPLPFVDDEAKRTLTHLDEFVRDLNALESGKDVGFTAGPREEYIKLMRQQARSGKVIFMRDALHVAPCFAVEKTGGRLREVWHGTECAKFVQNPPKPPYLGNPADLCALEASDDRPLMLSIRDGRSFFDQLQVPEELRKLFGKPGITLRELHGDFSADANRCPMAFRGLTRDEIRRAANGDGFEDLGDEAIVFPVSRCWVMGSSWASYVAQSVMIGSLRLAGVSTEQFLSATGPLPPEGATAFTVATDDVIAYERANGAEAQLSSICPAFQRLQRVWDEIGIEGKHEKALDRSLNGTCLGLDLVQGVCLMPKQSRLLDLVNSLITLLIKRKIAPSDLLHFLGVLQFVILANRPLFSCLGAIYRFAQAGVHDSRQVPLQVARELMLVSSLLCCLVIDLRADWAPFVFATDGAQDFGYGGVIAKTEPSLTRKLASTSRTGQILFRPEGHNGGIGANEFVMPLRESAFRTTFSLRSRVKQHSSSLEVGALCLMIQHIVRQRRNHRKRHFGLVDATALLFAVRKGRSSSANFRFMCRRIAALLLTADVQLELGYTPSRFNPADGPSRGIVTKHARARSVRTATNCENTLRDLARSYRHLVKSGRRHPALGISDWSLPSWTSSCSASTLVQPSSIHS